MSLQRLSPVAISKDVATMVHDSNGKYVRLSDLTDIPIHVHEGVTNIRVWQEGGTVHVARNEPEVRAASEEKPTNNKKGV